jgi:hypothetical protein
MHAGKTTIKRIDGARKVRACVVCCVLDDLCVVCRMTRIKCLNNPPNLRVRAVWARTLRNRVAVAVIVIGTVQAAFLDHLAQATAAERALRHFTKCGGLDLVRRFLEWPPENGDSSWTAARTILLKLGDKWGD